MKSITDYKQIERIRELTKGMMLAEKNREWDFDPEWVRNHHWKVVPVEAMASLPIPSIPRIVTVLNQSGYTACFAIATEDLGDVPCCYHLAITEPDFREYNRQLGLYHSLLTTNDRAWCISSAESFNLFAGEENLIEELLGKPISVARREFDDFTAILAKGDPSYPLIKMTERWASF